MNDSLHFDAYPSLFEKARLLRKRSTAAEDLLWNCLRDRNLNGIKFRRQHPILTYIVDFYAHSHKLIIEVDGGYHLTKEQQEYDEGRSFELRELGLTIVRFSNDEVMYDLNYVLMRILGEIA
ncbi:endonuclease domain-containing protein [Solitalea canadensis]|uniref:DUF559 domain-containing protein n=1 Tax=Solitalea canadensis (strain ATCC 29591 / DSM 3403 / JCM 21819 / LMG 8368 / NBRC 15130 / NCIMB 12057 / USAM 9D) TaxID=929556 RepID=H8KXU1_SOLCM|nr:endonuclease domain-containing protein [Solitalea canadensis]AFD05617.1 hypothetical protein Solca_0485 [Solitalea canadensis DSM 3403]